MFANLDQLFGILCRALQLRDTIQTPEDICCCIEEVLAKPGLVPFLGSRTKAKATLANVVMDWKALLGDTVNQGLKISMSGGLLVDATANHSFTFLSRIGHRAVLARMQVPSDTSCIVVTIYHLTLG
jgi:hypothetical protein